MQGLGEMAQWISDCHLGPNDLSSLLGAHMVEWENRLLRAPFQPPPVHHHHAWPSFPMHVEILPKKIKLRKKKIKISLIFTGALFYFITVCILFACLSYNIELVSRALWLHYGHTHPTLSLSLNPLPTLAHCDMDKSDTRGLMCLKGLDAMTLLEYCFGASEVTWPIADRELAHSAYILPFFSMCGQYASILVSWNDVIISSLWQSGALFISANFPF